MPVTPDAIRAAHARIQGVAQRTPVLTSRTLNARVGAEVFFKAENFQRGGAFKIRGATNFVAQIPDADRKRGIVAFSSGNHAQAAAIAAKHYGIPATIVMPWDAPRAKVNGTLNYGAHVVQYDRFTESREEIGARLCAETGATLVPPFDHEWIVTGQGTCALEFLEEIDALDALLVPLGGGGLVSGCAVMAKALRPAIRVYGIEPEAGNDYWQSLRAGERIEIDAPKTIADGLCTVKPGVVTFPLVRQYVDDVLLVTDKEIRVAMRFLLERMKVLVEPSGAVGLAALLHGKVVGNAKRIGIVLSGGNVDLEVIATL